MAKKLEGKVAWITGASSGIGRALAIELARWGAVVAVSARREEKLKESVEKIEEIGGRGLVVPCDVTREEDIKKAVKTIVEKEGKLDIAVANAGYAASGAFEELGPEVWRRQFDVNVVGLAQTARHALPELKKTEGRLALVGSVMGCISFPKYGPYQASKFAVRSIGQTLHLELYGTGVSCTTLQPGIVASEIDQRDNEGNVQEGWEDRRPKSLMWPTEKAARVMAKAIYKRKREYTFTGHGKIFAFFGKHFPGLAYFFMNRMGKKS